MVLLGLAFTLQRIVLDRIRADEALLMASQSACREIVLPLGPTGPVLSRSLAAQTFTSLLDQSLPSSDNLHPESTFEIAEPGVRDPHTGYVFEAEGVETSVRYTDIFLGQTVTQVLYMDAEVHRALL